ncbi:MAG: 3-deoxy-8-phosphooctulonate synthase [Bacteroidia bacterium]|nr:3-deoxy-8-phosphooctulonate synthase [Bacteroidia bacterium]
MNSQLPALRHANSGNFLLLAGPCVVENEEVTLSVARHIRDVCDRLKIPVIFKASYRKANRTRVDSFSGIGDQIALEILREVREESGLPVVTDIHESHEAAMAAEYVDVLQIPAFLCRQTDLLIAAAHTGKTVNVKKGQFLSPESMKFTVDKIRSSGNQHIMLTERGTMLGYQDLVVDFRGIPVMQSNKVPVILDITHSLQQPNQGNGVTGGRPDLIELIGKAGIAAGADGIFLETHPHPESALSDGANMLRLDYLEGLLEKLLRIHQAVRNIPETVSEPK